MKPMWGDYFFNATEGAACSGAQLKVRKDTFLDVLQLFCSYFNVTLFCDCPPFADLRLSRPSKQIYLES